MAALLNKFRIHYSSLKMLSDVEKPMQQETRKFFEDLIRPYRKDPTSSNILFIIITSLRLFILIENLLGLQNMAI